jgi:hypothetical protein
MCVYNYAINTVLNISCLLFINMYVLQIHLAWWYSDLSPRWVQQGNGAACSVLVSCYCVSSHHSLCQPYLSYHSLVLAHERWKWHFEAVAFVTLLVCSIGMAFTCWCNFTRHRRGEQWGPVLLTGLHKQTLSLRRAIYRGFINCKMGHSTRTFETMNSDYLTSAVRCKAFFEFVNTFGSLRTKLQCTPRTGAAATHLRSVLSHLACGWRHNSRMLVVILLIQNVNSHNRLH